jgi:Cys-tRNA(Pro)/Cys-tRNA(Cys) deacylase
MAKKNEKKTNAARMLDAARITYTYTEYDDSGEFHTGIAVAQMLGIDEKEIYKTLVVIGNDKEYRVCVIPVAEELDLKKAAACLGVKKIEMMPQKDILQVTGYVKGGCSPIGMKKPLKTLIDSSAEALSVMYISAGKRGAQIGLAPKDLQSMTKAEWYNISADNQC